MTGWRFDATCPVDGGAFTDQALDDPGPTVRRRLLTCQTCGREFHLTTTLCAVRRR